MRNAAKYPLNGTCCCLSALQQNIYEITYETQTLKGLGLSWRVQDGLQQAGIYTLADILTLSLTDAMRLPGIGRKGLLEIAEKVKDAGAHWDAWEEASE